MAWAAGTYTKANNATGGWAGDAALSIGIEAGRHDTQDNDFAAGINQCLNKDGSNSCTGNLNLGGNLPVNIGAGTAAAPAICAGNDIDTGIFSPAANQIGIATNGAETVRVDANGRVGVGTTTPGYQLSVQADSGVAISMESRGRASDNTSAILFTQNDTTQLGRIQTSTASLDIQKTGNNPILLSTNSTERVRVSGNGNVGIGTNNPQELLHVAGPILIGRQNASEGGEVRLTRASDDAVHWTLDTYGAGSTPPFRIINASSVGVEVASGATSWTAYSDIRYKKNIQPLSYGLDEALEINPIRFDYDFEESNDSKRVGFSAQEVQAIVPEAVFASEDGKLSLSATELIPMLINAIKELNTKVEALKAQLAG